MAVILKTSGARHYVDMTCRTFITESNLAVKGDRLGLAVPRLASANTWLLFTLLRRHFTSLVFFQVFYNVNLLLYRKCENWLAIFKLILSCISALLRGMGSPSCSCDWGTGRVGLCGVRLGSTFPHRCSKSGVRGAKVAVFTPNCGSLGCFNTDWREILRIVIDGRGILNYFVTLIFMV